MTFSRNRVWSSRESSTETACSPTTGSTCRSGWSRALLVVRGDWPVGVSGKARTRHGPQVSRNVRQRKGLHDGGEDDMGTVL